jgi:hypothetical protein
MSPLLKRRTFLAGAPNTVSDHRGRAPWRPSSWIIKKDLTSFAPPHLQNPCEMSGLQRCQIHYALTQSIRLRRESIFQHDKGSDPRIGVIVRVRWER